MYKGVYCTGRKHVRMESGEVDVGDGSGMRMQSMLNRGLRARQLKIPDQRSLVGSTDDPVVPGSKGGPLYICRSPWCLMTKMPRRREWSVQVDDMEALLSAGLSEINVSTALFDGTYEANATSRPLGEMVADPTASFTWMRRSWSKVGLS